MSKSLDILLSLLLADVLLFRGVLTSDSTTTRKYRIVLWSTRDLTSKLFQCQALSLWDKESGEAAQQHEERENLKDVVEPRAGVGRCGATSTERSDGGLSDDGSDLAGGGGDTVARGTVASWEALSGHDEGCRVGSEVEEELSEDVAC